KFMGVLGHSQHFYDADRNTIFKLFVNRNEKMKLDEVQEQKFLALKNSL
ncbi:MAG: heme utilization cystosolic carrier protein HutX, partial [Campylobacter sp.]|nr:heme utilization cystosolic carrier protein HutX [Campylobacter sp.]